MSLDAVVYGATEVVIGPTDTRPDGRPTSPDEVLSRIEHGALAIVDGTVASVGPTESVTRTYPPENATTAVDASGRAVLPGFVDPHTHALFAGDRSDEFAAKLQGKPYQEILAEGGGILRTVRAVRDASDERLLETLLGHLDTMLTHGTTTVEVKSGYGLDAETERRMLEVIDRADDRHPIDVVPTFMGAHAVPDDADADTYVDRVIDEQLPACADLAEFCDVFCDEGAFDVAQSRRVLKAGREAGLSPKIHADEFARLGASQLAAEMEASSADHLLQSTEADVETLLDAGVTPVVLPGTAFSLGADYADARAVRDAGGSLAVATDFNPNCHSESMPMAIALVCTGMDLTPAEALVGATRDAALALDCTDGTGTLREGAPGDVVVLDAPTHVHVPYNFGVNKVATVLKGGSQVHG